MPIFNLGGGKPFQVPILNSNLPADANVNYISGESKSATFKVAIAEAGHPEKYTYQWYVNGSAVSGATSSTYTKTGLTAGTYTVYCKVTNAAGSVTSRTATLTVTLYKTPVLDTSYPANASVTYVSGESKSQEFEVKVATAGVPATYTYQWYVDGSAVSGATSSTFTKTGLTAGTYSVCCKVTNAAGTVTSRTATLTVTLYKTPVLNTSYPANVTQVEKSGGSATFTVSIATAGVPASYTYQWYVNGSAVSGATSTSYTKTGLTSAATYSVYCKVTNAAGSVNSRTATLTVQSSQPSYTYSGSHTLVKEGTYDWKLTLKSSSKLKFETLGTGDGNIEVFLLGGGGGGNLSGGGGGFTKTSTITVKTDTEYTAIIGAGGSPGSSSGTGGTTSFHNLSVEGGKAGYSEGSKGGKGGSAGGSYGNQGIAGNGGSNGGNGGGQGYQEKQDDGSYIWKTGTGQTGQGTTTREFGESSGTLYSGGGGGGAAKQTSHNSKGYGGDGGGGHGAYRAYGTSAATAGGTNTGGGGGGGSTNANSKAGGSGIIVIRNKR